VWIGEEWTGLNCDQVEGRCEWNVVVRSTAACNGAKWFEWSGVERNVGE
jgi:hypothetical protein